MIRWLPLLILVLYFIFFNLGLSSYVWVITAEILPSEVTLPSFLSLAFYHHIVVNHFYHTTLRYFSYLLPNLCIYISFSGIHAFSVQIRNQIIPLAIFVSTLIWFLVTFFFQAMFDAMGGIYIFLFYAVASLFFTFTTFLFIPEMTGKTEEEIAMFYRNFKLCKRQTSKV